MAEASAGRGGRCSPFWGTPGFLDFGGCGAEAGIHTRLYNERETVSNRSLFEVAATAYCLLFRTYIPRRVRALLVFSILGAATAALAPSKSGNNNLLGALALWKESAGTIEDGKTHDLNDDGPPEVPPFND